MMTLYGANGSGSAAIEAALVLCGADYRVITAATWEADSALAELRQANRLQQIPTLVLDDGSVLSESAAILIHLGLTHPASKLLPFDAAARAQAIRGLVFIAANCYAAIGVIDYPERWCSDASDAATENLRSGARARLHHYWDIFADTFGAPQPFFGGVAPGALDVHAAVVSHWSGARAHLHRMRPALHALIERVDAHPALAPVFARHWPA
ncbi:MAG: glutathione S-transferase family protein [Burkholderiales bacterium]